MRFPSPKMSKETKQVLLSGITGGLVFHMEEAANGLVAGYPQFLKDRIDSNLPRNGQLVADLAPMGVGWVLAKKHPSARNRNIAVGLTLFDLPKLMHQIVWNVAYTAGKPPVTAPAAFRFAAPTVVPMVAIPSVPPRSLVTAGATGTGRYTMKTSVPKTSGATGIGKYR